MPELVEPTPTQGLLAAREAIRKTLAESGALSDAVPGQVRTWQFEVRSWQDTDSLDAAFVEGRLAYRTLSNVGRHYAYRTNDETQKRVLGLINNDNYKKPLMDDAVKGEGPVGGYEKGPKRDTNVEVLLNVGAAGIKRRLDPDNFVKRGPLRESRKFSMGLHELSAHLLDPRGFALKKYSGTTLIVLLPLPLPADVSLFYELRRVAKTQGSPAFRTAMDIVATEFIRPKLGSSLDMGTSYAYKPATETRSQSVKYVKAPSGATSPETPQQCRLNIKNNYRDILSEEAPGANEITLAVRKFGSSNKFPTFAIAGPGSNQMKEIDIELAARDSGEYSNYRETGWQVSSADFRRTRI